MLFPPEVYFTSFSSRKNRIQNQNKSLFCFIVAGCVKINGHKDALKKVSTSALKTVTIC